MKKQVAAIFLLMVFLASAALAAGGIRVGRKDLELNKDLSGDVMNVLVLLQDGDETDTMLIASVNSRTGRSVMTRLDCGIQVDVDGQTVSLGSVYVMGDTKSRGFLACRTVNRLLNLNISTYVALDMSDLPSMVSAIGKLNMQFDEEEAKAMGTWTGINELTGDAVLSYIRLELDTDEAGRSRSYDALMQMLYQGLHSGDLGSMLSMGNRILSSIDTNLSALTGMTLVSAVQGGSDRREVVLPAQEQILTEDPLTVDSEAMSSMLYKEIYE